ncbi:interleukin-12 subunit beta [Pholidichthys leucotaenia]
MSLLFLTAVCAALSAAVSSSSIETLADNVLVVKVPEADGSLVKVPLVCGEAHQNQPVFWSKNGEELMTKGNKITVEVEELLGGNYTCHLSPNGEYLNHTTIMVQQNNIVILQKKDAKEGHVHCSGLNYNGSFHCTWKRTAHRSHAAVFLLHAERNGEKIPCELDADGSGVRCQIDYCPYKEEQHRIYLSMYIRIDYLIEHHTKSFYLREIVRPAKLPNVHVNGKVFSWNYPDSWEKPCSYFGLNFEVKVVHKGQPCNSQRAIRNTTTDETKYKINFKEKNYVFCVRAQDKFTQGPWNHWSHCVVTNNAVDCSPHS